MNKTVGSRKWLVIGGIIGVSALSIALLNALSPSQAATYKNRSARIVLSKKSKVKVSGLKPFNSSADFKQYLSRASKLSLSNNYFGGPIRGIALNAEATMRGGDFALAPSAAGVMAAAPSSPPDRYSNTNVQIAGLDEPDIVKTDGQEIYYSSSRSTPYLDMPLPAVKSGANTVMRVLPPNYYNSGEVKLINALPAESSRVEGTITNQGDLLISSSTLVVFNYNKLVAYDVANKTKSVQKWSMEFGATNSLVGARLSSGQLYLALRQNINNGHPCPYLPLSIQGRAITMPCTAIYHPIQPVPTDVIYSLFIINPENGTVQTKSSLVGSSSKSIFTLSANSIFLTYFTPGDMVAFNERFFAANKDLVPAWLMDKLGRLKNYDISATAKNTEYQTLINQWQGDLNDDDRLKLQTDLSNRMAAYYPEHLRELEQTTVVKINIGNLQIVGTGSVPGKLLNQFSIDEFNSVTRLATTVGQQWWGVGMFGGSQNTVSDVYTLDSAMRTIGSVKNMGKGERIYAVRFIGDRGYVVTFKQTDPLFVLNLADPIHPQIVGELQIPGYSAYLHPLADHLLLGVGKEGQQMKLSLFNVDNPASPQEVSKFVLDEYWSETLSNHRAFLQDKAHQIFFIPGSKGGYVISYANNNLSLVKAVTGVQVQRALYVNDNLYIVGQDKMTIWNEKTWEKVNEVVW